MRRPLAAWPRRGIGARAAKGTCLGFTLSTPTTWRGEAGDVGRSCRSVQCPPNACAGARVHRRRPLKPKGGRAARHVGARPGPAGQQLCHDTHTAGATSPGPRRPNPASGRQHGTRVDPAPGPPPCRRGCTRRRLDVDSWRAGRERVPPDGSLGRQAHYPQASVRPDTAVHRTVASTRTKAEEAGGRWAAARGGPRNGATTTTQGDTRASVPVLPHPRHTCTDAITSTPLPRCPPQPPLPLPPTLPRLVRPSPPLAVARRPGAWSGCGPRPSRGCGRGARSACTSHTWSTCLAGRRGRRAQRRHARGG